jgi:hypothetical protein
MRYEKIVTEEQAKLEAASSLLTKMSHRGAKRKNKGVKDVGRLLDFSYKCLYVQVSQILKVELLRCNKLCFAG